MDILWEGRCGLPCHLRRGDKEITTVQKAELVLSVSFLGDIDQLAVGCYIQDPLAVKHAYIYEQPRKL